MANSTHSTEKWNPRPAKAGWFTAFAILLCVAPGLPALDAPDAEKSQETASPAFERARVEAEFESPNEPKSPSPSLTAPGRTANGFERRSMPANPDKTEPWHGDMGPESPEEMLQLLARRKALRVDSLQGLVNALVADAPARLGVYIHHVETGEEADLNADERFPAMSSIKTALAAALLERDRKEPGTLARTITIEARNQVPGSGILRYHAPGERLEVSRLLDLMIHESDNTAANTVIDLLGGVRAVNASIGAMGYENVRVLKKAFFAAPAEYAGLSETYQFSMWTPNELGRMYLKLDRGELIDPKRDKMLVDLMKKPHFSPLQIFLGRPGVSVANKTGSSNHDRADTAIIYTSDRGHWVLIAALKNYPKVQWKEPHPCVEFMANLSWQVYEYFGQRYRLPSDED